MENQLIIYAQALETELDWLAELVQARLEAFLEQPFAAADPDNLRPPPPPVAGTPYAKLVDQYALDPVSRCVLAMGLAQAFRPSIFDVLQVKDPLTQQPYTDFGGLRDASGGMFRPTVQTVQFLLAGGSLAGRVAVARCFDVSNPLLRLGWVRTTAAATGEGPFQTAFMLSAECLHVLTSDAPWAPAYTPAFPARKLHTEMEWNDLVLEPETFAELNDVLAWISHGDALMQRPKLRKRLKRGYRCLFHGPPGTGKTLAAALLGKTVGQAVYAIDLAQITSKYIGETEKNLSALFDQAEDRKWILFFDEADALFGKRTHVSDAKDRYANQETAYLLQRIEDYNGVVILATNFKTNLDAAFLRRFQGIIAFNAPTPELRLQLWQQAFADEVPLADDVQFEPLATRFSLSGGSIVNVLRHCALAACRRPDGLVRQSDLMEGIERELRKEGKAG